MTSIAATRAALVLAALFAGSAAAAAQSAPTPASPPPDQQSGRLVVERIEEGWLVAPDARAADLDGRVGSLVGGYAGHITDRTWLIGGGGYWLANRDDDFKMAYGGAVIEWLALKNHRVGFGVRTLVGGGTATLPVALGEIVGDATHGQSRNLRFGTRRVVDGNTRVVARDDFFIAEPQLNVLFNVTRRYRVSVGAGYRLIGAAPALGDALEGVSGSVSLQIGGR